MWKSPKGICPRTDAGFSQKRIRKLEGHGSNNETGMYVMIEQKTERYRNAHHESAPTLSRSLYRGFERRSKASQGWRYWTSPFKISYILLEVFAEILQAWQCLFLVSEVRAFVVMFQLSGLHLYIRSLSEEDRSFAAMKMQIEREGECMAPEIESLKLPLS